MSIISPRVFTFLLLSPPTPSLINTHYSQDGVSQHPIPTSLHSHHHSHPVSLRFCWLWTSTFVNCGGISTALSLVIVGFTLSPLPLSTIHWITLMRLLEPPFIPPPVPVWVSPLPVSPDPTPDPNFLPFLSSPRVKSHCSFLMISFLISINDYHI